MRPPRKTLNVHAVWGQVLNALDVKFQGQILPQTVTCPLCASNRLTIYAEELAGGFWHFCFGCRHAGDMIELAAATWQLSIQATMVKLQRLGVPIPPEAVTPDAVECYEIQHLAYRKRINDFWEESRKRLYGSNSRELHQLQKKLGLSCDITEERWNQGPAHLIGASTKFEVEKTFHPKSTGSGSPNSQRNSSGWRVFRGRRWGDVLVVPYYALPGKLAGFLFIGRDGGPDDLAYKRVRSEVVSGRRFELGLGTLTTVLDCSQRWGKIVFAMDDPLLALRIQMKQFYQNLRPLPIVIWSSKEKMRSELCWHGLTDRKVVFWSPKINAQVVEKAAATQGWISLAGPRDYSPEGVEKYVNWTFHDGLMRRIVDKGKKWRQAVAKNLVELTNAEIEDLFLQLRMTKDQIGEILDLCDSESAERVRSLLDDCVIQKGIVMKGMDVVENNNGWFAIKNRREELICNAILRLEQLVYQPRSKKAFYRGKILFKGTETPFCEPREVIEKNTGEWMQQTLLDHGQGLLQYQKSWNKDLLAVAQQFHGPKLVRSETSVGWDVKRACFILPGRQIFNGGQHEDVDRDVFPADCPFWSADYEPFERADALWLTHDQFGAGPQFWSLVAGLCSNLLAQPLGGSRRGLALAGHTQALWPGLLHLGCARAEEIRKGQIPPERTWLENDMPTPLTVHPEGQAAWRTWTKGNVEPNVALNVSTLTGHVLSCNGHWNVVYAHEKLPETTFTHRAVYRLIPSFLQYMAEQGLDTIRTDDLARTVVNYLREYLQLFEARTHYLEQTKKVARFDNDKAAAEAFADILMDMLDDRAIKLVEIEKQAKRRRELVRDAAENQLHVPVAAVDTYLRKNKAPVLDRAGVPYRLDNAGVLLGTSGENKVVWTLNLVWFEELQAKRKKKQQTTLKIVG